MIILRHGNDESDTHYKHDSHLKACYHCDNKIIEVTKQLIEQYGYPKKIYCSPFARVRETVDIMLKVFKKHRRNVEIIIEPNLSRYFTSSEQKNPGVRKKTLSYHPPIYENSESFKKRVDKVENKMKQKNKTWVITHYLVMRQMARNNGIAIPEQMPFLYSMVI